MHSQRAGRVSGHTNGLLQLPEPVSGQSQAVKVEQKARVYRTSRRSRQSRRVEG